jgi:hypothetical protein
MIIGLVGFIGSGKDTVAEIFIESDNCVKDSFAAPLKDLCASVFGWPRAMLEGDTVQSRDFRDTPDMFWSRKTGIPNFTPRLALQLIGTDVLRDHFHQDIWLNSLEYRIRSKSSKNPCVVISDARFQNELTLIKQLGGVVIWVQRGELPEWYDEACKANSGNAISRRIMETKYRDVHRSEWDWAGFEVDYNIYNDGTLDDLHTSVQYVQEKIRSNRLKAV